MSRLRSVLVLFLVCLCTLPLMNTAQAGGHTYSPALVSRSATTTTPVSCTWHLLGTTPWLQDLHTNYWYTVVGANQAISLTIQGTYPSARYASIQVYTSPYQSLTGLHDVQFPPDAGSINPFSSGTQRGLGTYTLGIVFGPTPSQPVPGVMYVDVPTGTPLVLVYRLYLPDAAATVSGNVPLPAVLGQNLSDGSILSCPTTSTPVPPQPVLPNVPFQQFEHFQGGGLYPNRDAAWAATEMSVTNQLHVYRFKSPTFAPTRAGQPITPGTQVRYWSFCLSTANKMPYQSVTFACTYDEQAPQDANGVVTIVAGPAGTRPANATLANGVVWMGTSITSTPYMAMERHLLPDPSFTQSIAMGSYGEPVTDYMGPYAPTVVVCSTSQFLSTMCK